MENEYQIEIKETLQKVVKVKANSLDEAINIVGEQYRNEEIILDENDFKGINFREYQDDLQKQIKVLYKEVGKKAVVLNIENDLEKLQQMVGGLIEAIDYKDVLLICNEEGKNQNELPNINIGYDYICGNFLVVGDDYENADFKSLTDEQIEKCKADFERISFEYNVENEKKEKEKLSKKYER